MPLLDHFHPPLLGRRHWEAFHSQWASCISSALNKVLPPNYFAEDQVHASPRIEVDVATWESGIADGERNGDSGGGVATLTRVEPKLAPADLTLDATFPPEFGVSVLHESATGPRLVAAVELVSPGNKDRDEARHAFAIKCAAYIQRAIGLIVIDIVTSRQSRPFDELLALVYPMQPLPETAALTAVSYRPTRVNEVDKLEIRHRSLEVGAALPVLPLALGGVGAVSVDFEATYEEARSRSRL